MWGYLQIIERKTQMAKTLLPNLSPKFLTATRERQEETPAPKKAPRKSRAKVLLPPDLKDAKWVNSQRDR